MRLAILCCAAVLGALAAAPSPANEAGSTQGQIQTLAAPPPLTTARAQRTIDLQAATYFGGGRFDHIRDAALDAEGFLYVTGRTASLDLPVTAEAHRTTFAGGPMDAFVAKIAPDLSRVIWCTYFGGSAYDVGYGIGVDAAGTVHVAGRTSSTDLPTTPDAVDRSYNGGVEQPPYFGGDVFVASFATDGRLLYATYWGGSADEGARNMAVDSAGSVYLVGRTGSSDLPVTAGAFGSRSGTAPDGFVVRLSADRRRVLYASYLGGTGEETAEGVEVGPTGDAYVAGATSSPDFPGVRDAVSAPGAGAYDVYVIRIAADGRRTVYETVLGGSGQDAPEQASVSLDPQGRVWVAGYTRSPNFPVSPGAAQPVLHGNIDSFVLGLGEDGSPAGFASYLGGAGDGADCWETAFGAPAVRSDGGVFVSGGTACPDFPVTVDALQDRIRGGADAFLTLIAADGSTLAYSTLLGGSLDDHTRGLLLAQDGTLYVLGQTQSLDFPVTDDALGLHNAGGVDAFIARFR